MLGIAREEQSNPVELKKIPGYYWDQRSRWYCSGCRSDSSIAEHGTPLFPMALCRLGSFSHSSALLCTLWSLPLPSVNHKLHSQSALSTQCAWYWDCGSIFMNRFPRTRISPVNTGENQREKVELTLRRGAKSRDVLFTSGHRVIQNEHGCQSLDSYYR